MGMYLYQIINMNKLVSDLRDGYVLFSNNDKKKETISDTATSRVRRI